jgi:hypothetical protein
MKTTSVPCIASSYAESQSARLRELDDHEHLNAHPQSANQRTHEAHGRSMTSILESPFIWGMIEI